MKQGAFAALCGIAQPMVSKYSTAGRLIRDAQGEIDALASLEALEGHLDEAKRQRALATLGKAHTPSAAGAGSRAPTRTAKAEREEIERDLKALQLARETGELVLVADVEAAARDAIAAMREAFTNGRRDAAARICAGFGIPSDRQAALARVLAQEFEAALGAFAHEMERAAGDMRAPRASSVATPSGASEGSPLLI